MADEIVARYRLETEAAAANARKLADANDKVTKSGVQAQGSLDKMAKSATTSTASVSDSFDKMATNVTNQLKGVATTMAAAFAVERLISFGAEAVKVAAKVEGVKVAFARLNDPTLLNELRKATKNTVDDLTLMQFAIRADNFKIPLEQLGVFLEFARRRAKETGTELNYMMESIMTAVGRGSIEVWDNLGISLTEVRSKLNGVSIETISVGERAKLMGDLATAELTKMGVEADTTADKLGQISATTENIKAEFGALIIDAIQPLNDELSVTSTELGKITGGLSGMELIGAAMKNVVSALQEPINALNKVLWGFNQGAELTAHSLMMIELAATKNFVALRRFMSMNDEDRNAFMDAWHGRADAVKAVGDELDKVSEKQEKDSGGSTADQIRNIYFLTNAIKALNEEAAKEGTTRERILEINKLLKPLEEDLAFLKGKQAKEAENAAEKLKKLKEAVGEYSLMLAKSIPGLRQFAVDSNGIGNSLNTLREMLNQAQEQFNSAEINSDAFKQAKADIEALSQAIEEAEGNAQISLDKMYTDVSSGILESAQLTREALEQEAKGMMQIADQLFNAIGTMSQAVTSMTLNSIQAESDAVEQQYRRREITQEQYEARQFQLRRKAAQAQKDQAQFSVIMNTSSAIMNALQTQPFYVGLALAAIAAAMGAAETAAIQSAPLPQFAKGGWVEGKKHSEGGTMIEAEKGEFIVSAAAAKRYAPILEQINKQTFQPPKDGWEGLAASLSINSQFTDRNLLAAIDRHRETDKSGFDKLASAILRASRGHNIRRGWN